MCGQIPALTAVQPLVHYLPYDHQYEICGSRPYRPEILIGFWPLRAAR